MTYNEVEQLIGPPPHGAKHKVELVDTEMDSLSNNSENNSAPENYTSWRRWPEVNCDPLSTSDKCDCTIVFVLFRKSLSKVYCCINNKIKFSCHNILNSCICFLVSMTFRIKESVWESHICRFMDSSSGESKDEYLNTNRKCVLLYCDRTVIGWGVLDLSIKW